jgi:flavin reductase (DIM6/NTAB) family NADH-FMN oxidoreductase RutF
MSEKTLHFYEPAHGHGLPHDPFKAIIGPRPIGWIASQDGQGHVNLAPYSFFNAFCDKPPIIGFASSGWKDTVRNVEETGEFVWNLATRPLAEAMNQTSAAVAHEVNEFQLAGLTAAPCRLVKPPRVAESPVAMECKLLQIIRLRGQDGQPLDNWLTLGEVVGVHIDRAFLIDGVYQTAAARPILRAGRTGDYVEITPDMMFEMVRPEL